MDGLDPENVKETIWKRSKTQLDVAAEGENPKNHNDASGGSNHCESLQLSALRSTCDPAPSSFALPLVPIQKVEEWCSNTNIVLAGTACSGGTGPPVGVVDIGVSKSAYYFCISLPGVKKDPVTVSRLLRFVNCDVLVSDEFDMSQPDKCSQRCSLDLTITILSLSGEFSCNIQRDGKVCIRGVTSTGTKTVTKYSRVFKMKLQQQCPPGPFTLFFSLPGPVDPRLFSPCFRSDGIFEAVVAKDE